MGCLWGVGSKRERGENECHRGMLFSITSPGELSQLNSAHVLPYPLQCLE